MGSCSWSSSFAALGAVGGPTCARDAFNSSTVKHLPPQSSIVPKIALEENLVGLHEVAAPQVQRGPGRHAKLPESSSLPPSPESARPLILRGDLRCGVPAGVGAHIADRLPGFGHAPGCFLHLSRPPQQFRPEPIRRGAGPGHFEPTSRRGIARRDDTRASPDTPRLPQYGLWPRPGGAASGPRDLCRRRRARPSERSVSVARM